MRSRSSRYVLLRDCVSQIPIRVFSVCSSSTAGRFARNFTLLKKPRLCDFLSRCDTIVAILVLAFPVFPHRYTHVCPNDLGKHVRGRTPRGARLAIGVVCRRIPEFGNFAAHDLLSSARKFVRHPAKCSTCVYARCGIRFNPLLFRVCHNRAKSRFSHRLFGRFANRSRLYKFFFQ